MKVFLCIQVDCPDGQLGKDKILDMYSMILPVGNAQLFVDQIFRIFDKDGSGTIDFKVSNIKYNGSSFLCCEFDFARSNLEEVKNLCPWVKKLPRFLQSCHILRLACGS